MPEELAGKRIVLGLTGGIACYKSAELLRLLTQEGATVDVVMTPASTEFITPTTMQALAGQPVYTDTFDARVPNNMAHITLTRSADAILVAPASTHFLARLANGLADDLLTTLCVARGNCPLLVAPAMNREMWSHPATQRNINQLVEDGVVIVGPGSGDQACGEVGDGRMLEPMELLNELIGTFQPKTLVDRRIVVTAGPTAEAIDPIRVITNRSSGKTGYAVAQAAQQAGASVTLISGPTALAIPHGVERIDVRSAQQMHDAVMSQIKDADVFISVAAVADWCAKAPSEQKIKKSGMSPFATLEFTPTPDILTKVAALGNGPWCVGFAAETENLDEYAQAKRIRKGIDLIVGNLAQQSMGTDDAQFVLFDNSGAFPLPRQPKIQAARQLVQTIASRLSTPSPV